MGGASFAGSGGGGGIDVVLGGFGIGFEGVFVWYRVCNLVVVAIGGCTDGGFDGLEGGLTDEGL